jgi:hypothetical protein
MILIVTLVFSLVLWVVLWGIGAKGIDAFMLSTVLMLTAAAAHIIIPMLPGNRRRDD